MKITFVLPEADLSGGVRVVAMHANRLRQRGHEVVVVSRPPRARSLRESLRRLKRGQWTLRHGERSHLDGAGVELRIIDRHRPVTDRDVPDGDVVVATWWETAHWVAALSASKGAKAYLIQHDERAMYPWPEQAGLRARVAATWDLPMFRMVVATWLKELLEERLGAGAARLVPNGIDLSRFCAPARGKQAVPTVGVMYATVRFKGCDVALRAYGLARKRLPELRLVAFGSEPEADHLPMPEGTSVVYRPPEDRIAGLYASCDAWLVASRSEGFGLPVLEAMACRTPVIATPAGAAPELLAGGGGELVPHDNAEAMAAAILRFAAMSQTEWSEVSAAALATARRHDWEQSADAMEESLFQAIGSRQGVAAGSPRDVVRS